MNRNTVILLSFVVMLFVSCKDEVDENEGVITVSGKLNYRGKPVQGATVDLDGLTQYQAITDANGEFVISPIELGSFAMNFTKKLANGSFSQRSENIVVTGSLTLDDRILPEPVTMPDPEITRSISGNTVILSWSPYLSTDFREYKVYEHDNSGLDETTGTLIHVTVDANDTTFTTSLPHSARKYYRVFVLSETGLLGGSNPLLVDTGPFPNSNTALTPGIESLFYQNVGETLWLSFDAVEGELYNVAWFDAIVEKKNYTSGIIMASAFREDKVTPYFEPRRLMGDTGSPIPVKAAASEKIFLKMEEMEEGHPGTFGVKIEKLEKENAQVLSVDNTTVTLPVEWGEFNLLYFEAKHGSTYRINAYNTLVNFGEFKILPILFVIQENSFKPDITDEYIPTLEWTEPWEIVSDTDQRIYVIVNGAYWYENRNEVVLSVEEL